MTHRELLHRPVSWITLLLCLVLVAAFALAAWSFDTGHRDACRSRDRTLAAVRDVFVVMQQAAASNPHQTPDQRDRADRFFKVAFEKLDAARCR